MLIAKIIMINNILLNLTIKSGAQMGGKVEKNDIKEKPKKNDG